MCTNTTATTTTVTTTSSGLPISNSGARADEITELRAQLNYLTNMRVDASRTFRMPAFFRDDPNWWFVQVECAFRNAGISQERTKADYVLGALDYEVGLCVRDLGADSDVADRYQKIKDRIISSFSSSTEARLRQLLKGQVLTDGKPSLILHRLRNLNSDKRVDDSVIRSIFLDHLPPTMRGILASNKYPDLDKLAEAADMASEIMNSSPQFVSAVSNNPQPDMKGTLDRIVEELAALNRKVLSLEKRDRSSSRNRNNSKKDKNLCWTHQKFGDKANSCRGTESKPCSFKKSNKQEN